MIIRILNRDCVFRNPLNENFSEIFGYANGSQGYEGFSYELRPLYFGLDQKGNDPLPKVDFPYYPGQIVKGVCLYDNKSHVGLIKQIAYQDAKPVAVYVIDLDIQSYIALDPKTVQHTHVAPEREVGSDRITT